MSPDTQDMEVLLDNVRRAGGAQDAPGNMVPEFDAFFEKLSSLDDLTLSDRPVLAGISGGITHKPIRLKQDHAANGGAEQGQKRKMQVLRSDFIQSDGRNSHRRGGTMRSSGTANGIPMGVMTFLKLATAAVLLFGVGLGSGWLALSLPYKSDEGFAQVQESPSADIAIVNDAAAEQDGLGGGSGTDVPAFSEQTETIAGGSAAQATLTEARRKEGKPQVKSTVTETRHKTKQAVKPVVTNGIAKSKANSRLAARSDRKYAIQVGACNSPACVNAYRKLLLGHVNADAIQVIERNVGGSQNGGPQSKVQRIRVVSLNASDASKLKASLAAADARFKDAYVITLPKSPSS